MHTRLLLFFALALAFLAPTLRAQDKVLLLPHWETGKVYRYEITLDLETSDLVGPNGVPGGGGPPTINAIVLLDLTVSTAPDDAKLKHVHLSPASIKVLVDSDGKLMTFDSADPTMSEPVFHQQMKPLVGLHLILVYDQDDQFKNVVVPGPIFPDMPEEATGMVGQAFAFLLREVIIGGLPGVSLVPEEKFQMEPAPLFTFPEGSVIKKLSGRLDSLIDHEGRKQAQFTSDGGYEISLGNAVVAAGPLPKLDCKGETLFDLERKAVSRVTLRHELKLPSRPGGDSLVIKPTTTATLKSIEDASAKK